MRSPFLALSVMLALASPSVAQAQLIATNATCRIISDTKPILARHETWQEPAYDGAVLQLCTFKSGKPQSATVYFAPHKNALGLCSMRTHGITVLRRRDGSYYQPRNDPFEGSLIVDYRLPFDGQICPRADDDRYLSVTGVPDGVFLELYGLWKTMHDTPNAFDGLLALDDERDRRGADNFKAELADPAVSARLVLTGILVGGRGDDPPNIRSTVFRLVVHDKADWLEWYELAVDWTPQGWRIVGMGGGAI